MITINGRKFDGNSIIVHNGKVVIDGVEVNSSGIVNNRGIVTVVVEGNVTSLKCDCNATINGNVLGDIDAGGNIRCSDVGGHVDAGGNVTAATVYGNIDGGGNVSVAGRVPRTRNDQY